MQGFRSATGVLVLSAGLLIGSAGGATAVADTGGSDSSSASSSADSSGADSAQDSGDTEDCIPRDDAPDMPATASAYADLCEEYLGVPPTIDCGDGVPIPHMPPSTPWQYNASAAARRITPPSSRTICCLRESDALPLHAVPTWRASSRLSSP